MRWGWPTEETAMTVGQHLIYHGPSSGDVMYGERVRVLRLIPSLTWFHADGTIPEPQPPCPPDPHLNRYIGEWCEVESENEPGLVFRMPQGYFSEPAAFASLCRAVDRCLARMDAA
jgi:hypothetical protein